jgi:hypothetical protein
MNFTVAYAECSFDKYHNAELSFTEYHAEWHFLNSPMLNIIILNVIMLVSISPIFYEQLFHTKVFLTAFMCLQFGLVIFWQKDFGTKAAHKMLVKLTPGCHHAECCGAPVGRGNSKDATLSYFRLGCVNASLRHCVFASLFGPVK